MSRSEYAVAPAASAPAPTTPLATRNLRLVSSPSRLSSVDGVLGAGQAERDAAGAARRTPRQHLAGAVGPGVDDEQPAQRLEPAGLRRRGEPVDDGGPPPARRAGPPGAAGPAATRWSARPRRPASRRRSAAATAPGPGRRARPRAAGAAASGSAEGRMPSWRIAPTAHSTGCLTSCPRGGRERRVGEQRAAAARSMSRPGAVRGRQPLRDRCRGRPRPRRTGTTAGRRGTPRWPAGGPAGRRTPSASNRPVAPRIVLAPSSCRLGTSRAAPVARSTVQPVSARAPCLDVGLGVVADAEREQLHQLAGEVLVGRLAGVALPVEPEDQRGVAHHRLARAPRSRHGRRSRNVCCCASISRAESHLLRAGRPVPVPEEDQLLGQLVVGGHASGRATSGRWPGAAAGAPAGPSGAPRGSRRG